MEQPWLGKVAALLAHWLTYCDGTQPTLFFGSRT
jgi:hypothetical protein